MTLVSGSFGCFDGFSTTIMSFCLTSPGSGICSLGGISKSASSSESEEDELDADFTGSSGCIVCICLSFCVIRLYASYVL